MREEEKSYFYGEEKMSLELVGKVAEEAYYGAFGRKKKQGEYTLEDYYALPEDVRVELIDGVFYDMSAPSLSHQGAAGEIYLQVMDYIKRKEGPCRAYVSPMDVQLDCDDRTMVQPDLVILCDPQKNIEKCIYGAPDFVLEVLSPSSRFKDLSVKLRKYEKAGVRECWFLDPAKRTLLVYFFEKENQPVLYGLTGRVPVGIYCGELEIDLDRVVKWGLER